jgi:hypothetical protein
VKSLLMLMLIERLMCRHPANNFATLLVYKWSAFLGQFSHFNKVIVNVNPVTTKMSLQDTNESIQVLFLNTSYHICLINDRKCYPQKVYFLVSLSFQNMLSQKCRLPKIQNLFPKKFWCSCPDRSCPSTKNSLSSQPPHAQTKIILHHAVNTSTRTNPSLWRCPKSHTNLLGQENHISNLYARMSRLVWTWLAVQCRPEKVWQKLLYLLHLLTATKASNEQRPPRLVQSPIGHIRLQLGWRRKLHPMACSLHGKCRSSRSFTVGP